MKGFTHRLVIKIEGAKDREEPSPLEGTEPFDWIQPGLPIPRPMVKPGSDGPDYLIQNVEHEDVVERGETIHVLRATVVPQGTLREGYNAC